MKQTRENRFTGVKNKLVVNISYEEINVQRGKIGKAVKEMQISCIICISIK